MYPQLQNAPLSGHAVLLRLDLDLPLTPRGEVGDTTRLTATLPSLKYCLEKAVRTLILGHLGRPAQKEPQFSLKPVQKSIISLINQDVSFIEDLGGVGQWSQTGPPLALLENLRFWPGEAGNDPEFARQLAQFGQVFVNEAFGTSHRQMASIGLLPRLLPSFIGFRFQTELAAIDRVLNKPARPLVMILGGVKPDKLEFIDKYLELADALLIGGVLARAPAAQSLPAGRQVRLASLAPDGLDITLQSATEFASTLAQAGTIVWNGPMGQYEDPGHRAGTTIVASAVANSPAFSLVGGGETIAAINQLGLASKIGFISVGGGALLYYLAHHTLPGLEAISPLSP